MLTSKINKSAPLLISNNRKEWEVEDILNIKSL